MLTSVLTGAAYHMVLEDIGAISLETYLEQQPGQRVTVADFLPLALQITAALGEIHAHHVVHKDLHAGNVLIQPQTQQIQITDFDLASLLTREEASVQPPASADGVLGFISPEQTGRMNRSIDYRTDYYTLGVLFYLMLSGRMPFEDSSPIALVHAHIARIATPLDQLNLDIPTPLARIVDKLMAKNTDNRYQSTVGLQADLEECQKQWQATGRMDAFPLARFDFSEHLQVSQTLYGREAEIHTLMQAFAQACTGHTQLLTIAGYSGVGKSSLVQEAHKPIAAHGGWFIAGKFEAFTRNIPYAALSAALRQWVQQVLAEPQPRRLQRKAEMLEALGSNARLLVDVQPEFALLLGDLPPLTALAPAETQRRLHLLMQQFFTHVASREPLILFLDDLQWADNDTLELLGIIAKQPQQQLLLILTWRDNEVTEGHLALLTVRALEQRLPAAQCRHITLTPLRHSALKQLLIDTLHLNATQQDSVELNELTALLTEKTDGNPFFVGEFLRRLHQDGLIYVNHERRRWEWDSQRIHASNITDNVMMLMLDKMQMLPPATQQLLQWAACLGSRFDLDTLARVCEASSEQVHQQLWPAVRAGVLFQDSSEWNASYASLGGQNSLSSTLSSRIHYRFLHDRMLQAAYESMDASTRQQRHRHIGQLLQKIDWPQQPAFIFTIVEHLNQSRNLIETTDERLTLVQLNLDAVQQAKAASAWPAAAHHAAIARELLPDDAWHTYYALAARTTILSVECEFLMTRADAAREFAEQALPLLRTGIEKAQLCLLLLKGFIPRQPEYAIAKGLEGLHYCNIQVPPADLLEAANLQEMQALSHLRTLRPLPEQLVFQSQTTPETDTVYALLSLLLMAGYASGNVPLHNFLGFRSIRYLLEQGLTESGMPTLGQALIILQRHHQNQESFLLAQRAMHIENALIDPIARAQFYVPIGTAIWLYYFPFQQGIDLLWKGYKDAMSAGDVTTSVICFSNSTFAMFAKGDELTNVARHLQTLVALMETHDLRVSAGKQYLRLIKMLQNPDQPDQLQEDAFDSQEWQVANQGSLFGFLQHLHLQWAFWREDFATARAQLSRASQSLILIPGCAPNIDHPLLEGLLTSYDETQSKTTRLQRLHTLREHLQNIGAHAPANFAHKISLLQAEEARLTNDSDSALTHYQAAIQSAQQHNFLQYHALASELLGNYLFSKDWTTLATTAISDAYYLYERWGCVVKQRHLMQRYPWLEDIQNAQPTSHALGARISEKRSSGQKKSLQLDLESLLKSMRVISGELRFSSLLSKLLHIIIENAGAQTASLVLESDNALTLFAHINPLNTEAGDDIYFPVAIDAQDRVPDELIRFVITTGKPLVIQNAATETLRFNAAYFTQNKPLSVLCMPIHYRDQLTGALYLENMLTPNAFTEDRLQLLEMLLAQAAVSLENAKLFGEVENFNTELEKKVEQRTNELHTANQELETFIYSVSHDLRSPIRNIKGFAQILQEQYHNALGEEGHNLLQRISRNSDKMSNLISGLLELSNVVRKEMIVTDVNLSALADSIAEDLQTHYPKRQMKWVCPPGLTARGDERLLYAAIENLLNNAWKYSSKTAHARIEFGMHMPEGKKEFFVRDNGAGFDMRHAEKLFVSFQRLHSEKDFPGTGIGLSTVQRVMQRHGGEIRAESSPGHGATFYFTLGDV